MKKLAIVLIVLLGTVDVSRSTIPVYDYVNHATAIVNEIKNAALWLEQYTVQLRTQIIQAEALLYSGNPASITNLPGIGDIASLAGTLQNFVKDIADIQNMVTGLSPQAVQQQTSQMLSSFGGSFNNGASWTSTSGVVISANSGLNQFAAIQSIAAQHAVEIISQIEQTRATIHSDIAQAQSALRSSTTEAETNKLNGCIATLQSCDTTLASLEHQLDIQFHLLNDQLGATREVWQQNQVLLQEAAYQQSGEVLVGQVTGIPANGTPMAANGIVATDYGYAGDFTPDSNSANGIGNHDNQLTSYTGPGSVGSAALSQNVANEYGLSVGQAFSVTTASGQTYQLTYDDTAPENNRVDIYTKSSSTLGGNNFEQPIVNISKLTTN